MALTIRIESAGYDTTFDELVARINAHEPNPHRANAIALSVARDLLAEGRSEFWLDGTGGTTVAVLVPR